MKKKKGSALLVVIIIIITIAVYINCAIFNSSNFSIISNKYDKILQNYYTSELGDISSVYDELIK